MLLRLKIKWKSSAYVYVLQIETWVSHTVHSREWTEGVNHARWFHSQQPQRRSWSLVTTCDLMCSLCEAETEFDWGDNMSRRFYREVMKTSPRAVWGACIASGVNTPARVAKVISVQRHGWWQDACFLSFKISEERSSFHEANRAPTEGARPLPVKDNISWKKMRRFRAPAAWRIFLFDLFGVNKSEEMTWATHWRRKEQ